MYDVKPDRVGWTVCNAETGQPSVLGVRLSNEAPRGHEQVSEEERERPGFTVLWRSRA